MPVTSRDKAAQSGKAASVKQRRTDGQWPEAHFRFNGWSAELKYCSSLIGLQVAQVRSRGKREETNKLNAGSL